MGKPLQFGHSSTESRGRRLYSDSDVERLRLIREAVAGGRRVGKLAALSVDELTEIVEEDRREFLAATPAGAAGNGSATSGAFFTASLEAAIDLDQDRLKKIIRRATYTLSPTVFIDEVATRLMHQIGDLWFEGQLSPAHEHLASGVMQSILADLTFAIQPDGDAPQVVVATPAGQIHGLGAMIVAAAAEYEGWHVTYLGADLPADDIARAADQANAPVVALSVTYPLADRLVEGELKALRKTLPDDVALLVGGQAAASYGAVLKAIGARQMDDLDHLRQTLREIASALKAQ